MPTDRPDRVLVLGNPAHNLASLAAAVAVAAAGGEVVNLDRLKDDYRKAVDREGERVVAIQERKAFEAFKFPPDGEPCSGRKARRRAAKLMRRRKGLSK